MSNKQILGILAVLIILAVLVGMWASRTQPVQEPAAGDKSEILGGTLTANGYYEYTEDKPYYKITAVYPANTGLSEGGDVKARTTIEQGLAAEIANFKNGSGLDTLTPQDAEIQNISNERKYMLDLAYKAYASAGSVSYVYQIYADTLGAHPNGYYLTYTFDQDGNQLALGDVLKNNPNWLEELSLLVSQEVTAELKSRLSASLPQGDEGADVTGALFAEGLSPKEENFKNFAVDGTDLLIFIPPYQVAAYAAGSFELRIPLGEINK